jgi:transposase InsO family protein
VVELVRAGRKLEQLAEEFEPAVFDFIERWYNLHRRHSALGSLSPFRAMRA